jgi:hypothetical protein
LGWVTCPPEFAPKVRGQWAAFTWRTTASSRLRIVHAGERVLAVYPPALEPE